MTSRSPHRTFIDASDFLDYAARNSVVSGIQRVIFKTISHACALHPDTHVLRYDASTDSLLVADSAIFRDMAEFDRVKICDYYRIRYFQESDSYNSLGAYLNSKYSGGKKLYHRTILPALNLLTRGRAYRKRRICASLAHPQTASTTPWRRADFAPGDRILALGSTWSLAGHGEALARARADGVQIVQMVHDLIPVMAPEFVGPGVPLQFDRYIRNVLETAHVILANSEATARDLRSYSAAQSLPAPKIVVTPLAHEFIAAPCRESRHFGPINRRELHLPENATPRVSWATAEPYALVVGTIESRKNILRLIRHWRRLLDKHGPRIPDLILAGKPGFQSQRVMATLDASAGLLGKITLVEKPDDAEMAFLYANCRFSICLSYYEGWGLPIGESLWFGRPVLASNVSSMPEVGGDLVDYAAPDDDAAIEAALEKLMFDDAHLAQRVAAIQGAKLRRWSEVVSDIWNAAQSA
jgi:glycosyltransferase involved in cell wall biosynthesis